MSTTPDKAFVLAAGRGLRMRPLTDDRPKPLIAVNGKPMIDHALDALADAGVKEAIVNLCYKGEMLEAHLQDRTAPRLTFSHETELLETGGGVKKEIAFFGKAPFFVVNADIVWTEKDTPLCQRLAAQWNPDSMDVLIALYPMDRLEDYAGHGDYFMDENGRLRRDDKGDFLFAGPRICKPEVFENTPAGAFSFLEIFDTAEKNGRLFGLIHEGGWYHVGTPEALAQTEEILNPAQKKNDSACSL